MTDPSPGPDRARVGENSILSVDANLSCSAGRKSLLSRASAVSSRSAAGELTCRQRVLLVMLGAALATALGVALALQPAAKGYGTHQQLGLPRCMFVVLFDARCPSCGMTTSWAYLVRGRLMHAAATNLGGMLLGITALVTAPWALASAVRGRWLAGRPSVSLIITAAVTILTATVLQWLGRIAL